VRRWESCTCVDVDVVDVFVPASWDERASGVYLLWFGSVQGGRLVCVYALVMGNVVWVGGETRR
jgi:hypothetical protein